MTVTIHDVARTAGVGAGTVSRVVNGGSVSAAMRERILGVIEELGFRPSSAGRALARGRSESIAVLVPFITHASAVERVRGLVDGFRLSGLPVTIFDVEEPAHQREHILALAGDLRPEGLVIVSLHPTREEIQLLGVNGPRPVLIDSEAEGLSSFTIDDLAGGRSAVEHLLELGHTRVAFIGDLEGDRFGFTSSERRHRGYLEALRSAGITRSQQYERTARHGEDTARTETHALLDLPEPPTAIFAASDTQALGVLRAARERHLRVPENLSVIGFDDIAVAELLGLTTVHQPLVDSGRVAASVVLRQRDDPHSPSERMVLPTALVIRTSTGPARRPRARRRS